nr:unnamed protein product [Spirometra erinaceieuropaei]
MSQELPPNENEKNKRQSKSPYDPLVWALGEMPEVASTSGSEGEATDSSSTIPGCASPVHTGIGAFGRITCRRIVESGLWATSIPSGARLLSASFNECSRIAVGSEKFLEELHLVQFGDWSAALSFHPSV